MEKSELEFVAQLINVIKESEPKFEEFYNNKNAEKFNEIKKFILSAQKEIDGELK